jgi:hypothetical protein
MDSFSDYVAYYKSGILSDNSLQFSHMKKNASFEPNFLISSKELGYQKLIHLEKILKDGSLYLYKIY